MLILQTAQTYFPLMCGISEVVGQISTRLARLGHEVHVATEIYGSTPREEVINGVHVHRFPVSGNGGVGIKGDVKDYLGFVMSRPWDVVGMHCAQTWTTDALMPHLDRIKAGKIFIGHGLSALGDSRYECYFRSLPEYMKQMNQIVSLSRLLEETSFCTNNKLDHPRIIPNGVDHAEWMSPTRDLRCRWGIGENPWLLTVSNHSPVKGHEMFRKVVREVRHQMPDVVGTLVGGSYPAAKWGMGRLGLKGGCWYRCHASACMDSSVQLRSGVPRVDVVSAIQEADIVVLTSIREASPLVILESMAAGTPWVSFNVGCVEEHAGGFVVKDLSDMARMVRKLIAEPELRVRLGEAGRIRARELHDWDQIVSGYEDMYSRVSGRSNG